MVNKIKNIRLRGIVALVISPVYVPYCLVVEYWGDVRDFYRQVFHAIRTGEKL